MTTTVTIQRNTAGLEDLALGVGTSTQVRGIDEVTVTKINAANLPYDEVLSLSEKITEVLAALATITDKAQVLADAVAAGDLLQVITDDLPALRAWLASSPSSHQGAFNPFSQTLTQDATLASGINYATLGDLNIAEGVHIDIGAGSNWYVLGSDKVPSLVQAVIKTADYTATLKDTVDKIIYCDTNSFTITLPDITGVDGLTKRIKNRGVGVITITGNGTQTIDGIASLSLTTQNQATTLTSFAGSWFIF